MWRQIRRSMQEKKHALRILNKGTRINKMHVIVYKVIFELNQRKKNNKHHHALELFFQNFDRLIDDWKLHRYSRSWKLNKPGYGILIKTRGPEKIFFFDIFCNVKKNKKLGLFTPDHLRQPYSSPRYCCYRCDLILKNKGLCLFSSLFSL